MTRLLEARRRNERVAIVGDYDVDGITGTALLVAVFTRCGIATEPILPNRLLDGYGFQTAHVDRAQSTGCSLIVTVDCGSTARAAVERAREAGVDVIITDHHLSSHQVPAETIQINPHQAACRYPFRDLTGAGLALKLAQAVALRCDRPTALDALLRIACLGTIADVAPLIGENRTIASLGLKALRQTRSEGLRALIRIAGVVPPFSRHRRRLSGSGRDSTPRADCAAPTRRSSCSSRADPERCGGSGRRARRAHRERQAEERPWSRRRDAA